MKPVGRFAPTPSGRMHLGNVFAALLAWLSVRSRDGEMVLRMEDLEEIEEGFVMDLIIESNNDYAEKDAPKTRKATQEDFDRW